jgi:LDH2 family malate/lactate/ureidoglycolate dehydrogenase
MPGWAKCPKSVARQAFRQVREWIGAEQNQTGIAEIHGGSLFSYDHLLSQVSASLRAEGMIAAEAQIVAQAMVDAQRDESFSHGIYRLLGVIRSMREKPTWGRNEPKIRRVAPGIVLADAADSFAPYAFHLAMPILVEAARSQGIAALAIRNCLHLSALWPEVEPLAREGLSALAMTPNHAWMAPAGGTRPVFGTNPIAFSWPRPGRAPFVFDFATSEIARGEIELHRREGKAAVPGWGLDADGNATNDPAAILAGAMLPFGGHKGSALAAMVELLAASLVGDLLSRDALAEDGGEGLAPRHGEIVIAFDPARFATGATVDGSAAAEAMFADIAAQGARLPGDRRYAARARSEELGIWVSDALLADISTLTGTEWGRSAPDDFQHQNKRSATSPG